MGVEQVLGPAHALDELKPGQVCVVILDAAGAMFVRSATDGDALAALRKE